MAWLDYMRRLLDKAAAEEAAVKVADARDFARDRSELWDEFAVEKGLVRGGEEE